MFMAYRIYSVVNWCL